MIRVCHASSMICHAAARMLLVAAPTKVDIGRGFDCIDQVAHELMHTSSGKVEDLGGLIHLLEIFLFSSWHGLDLMKPCQLNRHILLRRVKAI